MGYFYTLVPKPCRCSASVQVDVCGVLLQIGSQASVARVAFADFNHSNPHPHSGQAVQFTF